MNDEAPAAELTVRALGPDTWPAFADLVERHNGVWGGCWCTWFHTMNDEKAREAGANRALKERLVCEGRAHAALVFDDDIAVGWCQYGPPAELPNIKHRKEYEATTQRQPDYRITCFFIDRRYRRQGVARVALQGALDLIAQDGGGLVEGYPHDIGDQVVSSSFLYSVKRSTFEEAGFTYDRPKGAKNCVMTQQVAPR